MPTVNNEAWNKSSIKWISKIQWIVLFKIISNHADKLEFESLVYSTLTWTEEKHMSLQHFTLRIDFIIKTLDMSEKFPRKIQRL